MMNSITLPSVSADSVDSRSPSRLWPWAQGVSVVVAVGVVLLLLARPELGLVLTWDVLVPAVPLVLLLAPRLWRNLCPIAVVHQLPARLSWSSDRRLGAAAQRRAPVIAVGLFLAIVPLRLVVFNESGPALAAFVLAVLGLALLGGVLLTGKAGWCATFCPVLPVERLYGQSPPVSPLHAHCEECTGCTRGCYDLGPERSLRSLLPRRSRGGDGGAPAVFRTPMGAFLAAFPGFVAGYFLAPEAPGVLTAYAWTLGGAAASVVLVALLQAILPLRPSRVARLAAGAALLLYYWFTLPAASESIRQAMGLAGPVEGVVLGQAAVVGVVGLWFMGAERRAAGGG